MASTRVQRIEEIISHSRNTYHIQFMDYRANHLSQGVIALARLDANIDQIKRFEQEYVAKRGLEDKLPVTMEITKENFKDYIGTQKNEHYSPYLKYFSDLVSERGWESVLREYYPGGYRRLCGLIISWNYSYWTWN
eukprot:TRINITY_DN1718_c0_g2_i1.p2 TRINITY_DN1718_c0_g2~~TRINITY_DN1718_c0_g2_i1.p2  ORF type:complete len:136 (+),score=24.58 TRINITY_DN1718_c0_g2_i1:164-571(+)